MVLPAATDGELSYTLRPLDALPAGLTYTAQVKTTGSGDTMASTPTLSHPATTYTLTAIDRDVDRATLKFTLAAERTMDKKTERSPSR